MRAVVQRVSRARVRVNEEVVGEIGRGVCVLLGVARGDGSEAAARLAANVARLRVFENEEAKFDISVIDIGGGALVVSQFTLLADTRKGNRPSLRTRPSRAMRKASTTSSAGRSWRKASRSRRASSGREWPSSS